jgi:hypothetical protein
MSERVESLSTWWKPVDGGSNPSAPTPKHSQYSRHAEKSRVFLYRGMHTSFSNALKTSVLTVSILF